ncbi:hypothetical protein [Prochlorothrix hollandica]|uniref:hypothetical protein n=1 Tax=Prochlorothrix hollandica TaxID=1223 RepID=UPI000381E73B|nr:hypothetical protein [Prochlorothrix hollandica]
MLHKTRSELFQYLLKEEKYQVLIYRDQYDLLIGGDDEYEDLEDACISLGIGSEDISLDIVANGMEVEIRILFS